MRDHYDSFFIRCLALSTILVCTPLVAALITTKLIISAIFLVLGFVAALIYMFVSGVFGVAMGIIRPLWEDTFNKQILDYWDAAEQRDFFIWCFVLGVLAGGSFAVNVVLGVMVSVIVAFAIMEMANGWMVILKTRHNQACLDKQMQEIRASVGLV
jgi:hypothetical protein